MGRLRVVFGSRNRGKLVEIRELLGDLPVDVVGLSALSREVPDVEEDRPTFEENAVKKARAVAAWTGMPALADDSGLEVDALGGAPGVRSARYAGTHGDDRANNEKLLAALFGVPPERRTARFRAVVAFADPAGPLGERVLVGHGACEGWILDAPRGTGGFGYDPLFFCPELGQTFAEAGIGRKGGVSHRARAVAALRPELSAYLRSLEGGGR